MREAVALAEAVHGQEKTVGLMEIIQTDWMSSEHSDCGNMDPDDFKKHREQQIGFNKGWEVRKLSWRARKVRLHLNPLPMPLTQFVSLSACIFTCESCSMTKAPQVLPPYARRKAPSFGPHVSCVPQATLTTGCLL